MLRAGGASAGKRLQAACMQGWPPEVSFLKVACSDFVQTGQRRNQSWPITKISAHQEGDDVCCVKLYISLPGPSTCRQQTCHGRLAVHGPHCLVLCA